VGGAIQLPGNPALLIRPVVFVELSSSSTGCSQNKGKPVICLINCFYKGDKQL
jgi:hypothetical protein